MTRKTLLLLLMAVYWSIALAQTKDSTAKKHSCSCGFNSILNLGFTEGSEGSGFLLQTINGFRYKTWFIGAGAGLDYYHLRGIPVFVDVRKAILKKPETPFVYADYGIHYSWARDKDKQIMYFGDHADFNNGTYYDIGIGYQAQLKNKDALLFSLGYSYKYLVGTVVRRSFYCPGGDCPDDIDVYRYKLNRLSLKAGWQF